MNMNLENQTRRATADPYFNRLTTAILSIARLPSAPTFDWTTQAAQALTPLHASTTFGVVIAQHNHDHNQLNIESSGVCLNQPNQHPSDNDQARSTLERLASTQLSISDNDAHAGYIAPLIHVFPQCAASKASIPWAPGPPHHSRHALVAYSTLPATINDQPNTSIALLIFASPHESSQSLIDPTMLAAALSALTYKAAEAINPDPTGTILWLTQREQAILDQLILGNSVRTIAEDLGRSPHTVHDHVKNLHRKLGASSRGQLIARAIGHQGLVENIDLIAPTIDPELTETQPTPPSVTELKPASIPNTAPVNHTKQQATPLNQPANQPVSQSASQRRAAF